MKAAALRAGSAARGLGALLLTLCSMAAAAPPALRRTALLPTHGTARWDAQPPWVKQYRPEDPRADRAGNCYVVFNFWERGVGNGTSVRKQSGNFESIEAAVAGFEGERMQYERHDGETTLAAEPGPLSAVQEAAHQADIKVAAYVQSYVERSAPAAPAAPRKRKKKKSNLTRYGKDERKKKRRSERAVPEASMDIEFECRTEPMFEIRDDDDVDDGGGGGDGESGCESGCESICESSDGELPLPVSENNLKYERLALERLQASIASGDTDELLLGVEMDQDGNSNCSEYASVRVRTQAHLVFHLLKLRIRSREAEDTWTIDKCADEVSEMSPFDKKSPRTIKVWYRIFRDNRGFFSPDGHVSVLLFFLAERAARGTRR